MEHFLENGIFDAEGTSFGVLSVPFSFIHFSLLPIGTDFSRGTTERRKDAPLPLIALANDPHAGYPYNKYGTLKPISSHVPFNQES